jgi:hypothetical protein
LTKIPSLDIINISNEREVIKMTLYKREIMIKDRDWDGPWKTILDWTPEDEWNGEIPNYRYEYEIVERFVKID